MNHPPAGSPPTGRRAPLGDDPGERLLAEYDHSLPQVYGYLLARVGNRALAEDLTSQTYLAAVDSIDRGSTVIPTTAWLIGIARHKLVDHWRHRSREERRLQAVAEVAPMENDPWAVHLEAAAARDVLARLDPVYRAALVLRYVDDLPLTAVAEAVDRSPAATESLLARARRAFRTTYELTEGSGS